MTDERKGVLVHAGDLATTVTLDRPTALNALTTPMVRAIKDTVETSDRSVVICSAHPKVFCAGGDIRAVRAHALAAGHIAITDFFRTEYAMNLAIADATSPVVSVVDGICLGGGLGIAGHSRVHVVTDRASLAMPESAIGFFPDVGMSHLLAAAPGGVGLYLGMTGARVGPDDAVYSGLATNIISARDAPAFIAYVQHSGIKQALAAFERPADLDLSTLHTCRADIDRCFSAESVGEVIERVSMTRTSWGTVTLDLLMRACPQSLATAFALIKLAAGRTLAECLATDLSVAEAMVRTPDFLEGVGAKLVDKNRPAVWVSQLGDPPVAVANDRWVTPGVSATHAREGDGSSVPGRGRSAR